VTRDFLPVMGWAQGAILAFEGSIGSEGGGGTLDPTEEGLRSPVKDDDVLRNPRFAASLVIGALVLTPDFMIPDFTLPLFLVWCLTGGGRDEPLTGLEGPAAGMVEMDNEEGRLERCDMEEFEATGMRDLDGEL
jgi:hypothetical protein